MLTNIDLEAIKNYAAGKGVTGLEKLTRPVIVDYIDAHARAVFGESITREQERLRCTVLDKLLDDEELTNIEAAELVRWWTKGKIPPPERASQIVIAAIDRQICPEFYKANNNGKAEK